MGNALSGSAGPLGLCQGVERRGLGSQSSPAFELTAPEHGKRKSPCQNRGGQSKVYPPLHPTVLLANAATVWGLLNDIAIVILFNGMPEDDEDSGTLDEEAEEVYYACFRGSTSIPNEISVVTQGQTS